MPRLYGAYIYFDSFLCRLHEPKMCLYPHFNFHLSMYPFLCFKLVTHKKKKFIKKKQDQFWKNRPKFKKVHPECYLQQVQ